jgi:hypothetical protein
MQNRPLLVAVGRPRFVEAGRWYDTAPTASDVSANRFDVPIGLLVAGRCRHQLLAVGMEDEAVFGRWLAAFEAALTISTLIHF